MKVVVADANLLPHRQLFEARLPAESTVTWLDPANDEALIRELRNADVFVGSRFTAAMGASATVLRLVHAAGAGYDGIDLAAVPPTAVCANTFHHQDSIAEYVVASLIVLRRGLRRQDAALRHGVWSSSVYDRGIPQSETLAGSVATFLGFGHIGKAAWRLLHAFGVEGIAVTRTGRTNPDLQLRRSTDLTGLPDALVESDILIVSVPLTNETTSLIGRRELALLGSSGLLVNYEALHAGLIGGAAIDVWYRYPEHVESAMPSSMPFGRLENVLMTPHSSGVTADTFRARAEEIAENISRLEHDQPIKNQVHP